MSFYKTNLEINQDSDAYIFVKRIITIAGAGADATAKQADEKDVSIEVIIKNCAPFINFMSEINNNQVDNVKDLDVVMLMYSLIKYCDNYSKTSVTLWQY